MYFVVEINGLLWNGVVSCRLFSARDVMYYLLHIGNAAVMYRIGVTGMYHKFYNRYVNYL